uniref:Uncharacterized protein n=1 Tax=Spongospora subterranea TaxID=70186 RepID=A0A0H5QI78_9EUKA|eukprot:CRZ01745.1 hypothetical protein [Spongospora subterranea]
MGSVVQIITMVVASPENAAVLMDSAESQTIIAQSRRNAHLNQRLVVGLLRNSKMESVVLVVLNMSSGAVNQESVAVYMNSICLFVDSCKPFIRRGNAFCSAII